MPERTRAEEDRRRSARFLCGGLAKISCLPSNGVFIPGTIRDLSLHGCCVDLPQPPDGQPMDCGNRAEIVVRVNAASFRAVGEVRARHGLSAAGLEFVHLSTGGKDLLADMIGDLARLQAVMNKLKATRREMDAEAFRRELEEGRNQAALLSARFPILGTILKMESSGDISGTSAAGNSEPEQLASPRQDRIVTAQPLVIAVDLFG